MSKTLKRLIEEIRIPHKSETLSIDRVKMPQVKSADVQDFFRFLKTKGVKTAFKKVDAANLKATQGEFDSGKVEKMIADIASGKAGEKPIIVSKDGYVIDGHHRWLAYANIGKPLPVYEVNTDAMQLIRFMREYPKSFTKSLYEAFGLVCEGDECPIITVAQMKEFERVVDQLFKKFNMDFEFTKHFRERMAHERNDPCISLKEIAELIKKLYNAKKAGDQSLNKHKDAEAVLKDMQTNVNIPIAIEYDRKNDSLEVVMKTVMRKRDFKSPDPIIRLK